MKASSTFALALGSLALAGSLAAQAGVRISDSERITNGGTGHIGLTQEASRPMATGAPVPGGEATTFLNGQPNVNPDTAGWSGTAPDARRMGASAAPASHRTMPAGWGTPD